ncbi:hypothetical protein J3E68DRAFT_332185 [Trichoderma sp. SZMC 28012]
MLFRHICIDNSFPRKVAQGMGKDLDARIHVAMDDGSSQAEIQLKQLNSHRDKDSRRSGFRMNEFPSHTHSPVAHVLIVPRQGSGQADYPWPSLRQRLFLASAKVRSFWAIGFSAISGSLPWYHFFIGPVD